MGLNLDYRKGKYVDKQKRLFSLWFVNCVLLNVQFGDLLLRIPPKTIYDVYLPQEGFFRPLSSQFHPLPTSNANTFSFLPAQISFACSGNSYKWEQTFYTLLCLDAFVPHERLSTSLSKSVVCSFLLFSMFHLHEPAKINFPFVC